MVNKKIDKPDFIRRVANLLNKKGYHYSSVEEFATECGLSKASVYHYVASKKELAEMALTYFHSLIVEEILKPTSNLVAGAEEKLQFLAEKVIEFFSQRAAAGCLVTNLAHELLDTEPDFRQYFAHYYDDWLQTIAAVISERISKEKAILIAEDALAQLVGALLFSRLHDDVHFLVRAAKRIGTLLSTEKDSIPA